MTDILVLYRHSPAALVGPTRFSYLGEIRHLPPGHPTVRMVTHMGYYAQLVLTGQLPDSYADEDAERFARFALIDPEELQRRARESDAGLAARFRVPAEQIELARQELREQK
jgi:hypothetical protein